MKKFLSIVLLSLLPFVLPLPMNNPAPLVEPPKIRYELGHVMRFGLHNSRTGRPSIIVATSEKEFYALPLFMAVDQGIYKGKDSNDACTAVFSELCKIPHSRKGLYRVLSTTVFQLSKTDILPIQNREAVSMLPISWEGMSALLEYLRKDKIPFKDYYGNIELTEEAKEELITSAQTYIDAHIPSGSGPTSAAQIPNTQAQPNRLPPSRQRPILPRPGTSAQTDSLLSNRPPSASRPNRQGDTLRVPTGRSQTHYFHPYNLPPPSSNHPPPAGPMRPISPRPGEGLDYPTEEMKRVLETADLELADV